MDKFGGDERRKEAVQEVKIILIMLYMKYVNRLQADFCTKIFTDYFLELIFNVFYLYICITQFDKYLLV